MFEKFLGVKKMDEVLTQEQFEVKKYQLFPTLTAEEYTELKEDIAQRGVQVPVEKDEAGNILDGHHRVRACEELGIKNYPVIVRSGMTEAEKHLHIRKLNLARRHLTVEQRRTLIAEQLQETPEKSDRQIAKEFDVDHKTVGKVRQELEESGDVGKFPTSLDTLGRKQPRKRSRQEVQFPEIRSEASTEGVEVYTVEDNGLYNPDYKSVFNATNESIDWAKWTWNPATGCKHECAYCYARDIANRFYPEKFEPTFRPERLEAPKNTVIPESRKEEPGINNVFVCSMADLFGDWVPQEWIDKVISIVREASQWNFLFLTKNPKRLVGIDFPENAWVGTTVDIQARVKPAEEAFRQVKAKVKFVSCEPLLEPITFSNIGIFDWIIIGGRSKNSNLPELQPEWAWVESLIIQAREAVCKVYCKPNLNVSLPKEYPMQLSQ